MLALALALPTGAVLAGKPGLAIYEVGKQNTLSTRPAFGKRWNKKLKQLYEKK